MAGDVCKKVQPGQRLEITAETFNAFSKIHNPQGQALDIS